MNKKYYLTHITTECNCNKIKQQNKFNISKHGFMSSQWLGDGIYFWSGNDEAAIELGKRMVHKKIGNVAQRIQSISLEIYIPIDKHINLDDKDDAKTFADFLRNGSLCSNGTELLEILKTYKSQDFLNKSERRKLGYLFGTCVNLFQTVMQNEKKISIDAVSYSFYSGKTCRELFSLEELCYRQFCIKNASLVNDINVTNWDIEYI